MRTARGATVRDIAKLAGVSVASVSRALNHRGEISEEKRRIVLNAARKLRYVRNSQARALVLGRTHTVGVMVHDNTSPIYAQALRGIEEVANAAGLAVLLYNSADSQEQALRGLALLRANRVDGLLFTPVQTDKRDIQYLSRAHIPYVLLFRHFDAIDSDYVILDTVRGGYIVTKHLLELGHRRIAHIGGPPIVSSAKGRLDGFALALAEEGLVPDIDLVTSGPMTIVNGYEAAMEIFGRRPRPTAIFAATDLQAAGVLKAAAESRVKIPKDVALVGGDDIELAGLLSVPLTTFHQPAREMGKKGAEILIRRLASPERPREQICVEPTLVVRDSSGGTVS